MALEKKRQGEKEPEHAFRLFEDAVLMLSMYWKSNQIRDDGNEEKVKYFA